METRNKIYYNYEDEEESYYDYDESYDGSSSYDDLLDFIIDNLQRFGCNYSIDEIEDFLTVFDDVTLAEWSRDLMDPSILDFTCNYIIDLMNQKYSTPTKITPPINRVKCESSASLLENEKAKVQVDEKCDNLNDNKTRRIFTAELKTAFTRAAFQHWRTAVDTTRSPTKITAEAKRAIQPLATTETILKEIEDPKPNTNMKPNISKIFTKELKTMFTRAAFQQWKIVAQDAKIQDLLSIKNNHFA